MSFSAEKYISKVVNDIPPSSIRRFFDLVAERPDAISLSIGEPDFVTPRSFCDAAVKSLQDGKTAYAPSAGIAELRSAIGVYLKKQFQLEYDYNGEILITVGGSEAIDITLRALLDPGDEILIPDPAFVSYQPCALMAGAKAVSVPTYMENGFKVTTEELEKYVTPKTKVLLINYPSNPTGAIMGKADLEQLALFAQKYNLLVISDEIYGELTYGSKHCSMASLPGMRERTILISGFSKAFAMTGWRVGYLCAPKALTSAITKVHQYAIMCSPTISQYAALEAMTNGHDEVRRMVAEYEKRRDFVVSRFQEIGLPVSNPEGAFYAFPNITKSGLSSEQFCQQLLHDFNVAAVPGNAFGERGEGFIRCSYATSMEKLQIALERMERFLQSL